MASRVAIRAARRSLNWWDWASWDERLTRIAAHLAAHRTEPLAVAPLIVEYRAGQLSARDGNHRYGAMQRLGWTRAWGILWHNSRADFENSREVTLQFCEQTAQK